jgi:3',5'-cyclic AMP phosphodiesterase CpdA
MVLKDIRAHQPDHVALTGDLINISLPAEYDTAGRWLEDLGGPEWITVVPGNHDAYIDKAWRSGIKAWGKYLTGDMRFSGSGQKIEIEFPFVRLRRYAAIIGVSSARSTGIGNASGWLGVEQIEALKLVLSETRQRGFYRILLIHHPPVPGLCSRRKSLLDSTKLLKVLEAEGAELVLFGHNHLSHHIELSSRYGPMHMFAVPSASLWAEKGIMAGWNLYNIRRRDGSWQTDVTIRTLDRATQSMTTASQVQFHNRRAEDANNGQ